MTRAKRQSYVDAAQLSSETAVLMLWVDDVHADAAADRAHHDGRQQVRLARTRMAEYTDVGVRIKTLIERIDQHWRPCRGVAPDEQSTGLLHVRLVPRKEGREGTGVEDALALQSVRAARPGCNVPIEHAEVAGSQLAKNRARRRLDPPGTELECFDGGRRQREIDGHMKGLVLTRDQAAL